MKILVMSCSLWIATVFAVPSSIDQLPLPQEPSRRYGLKEVERVKQEAELWFERYSVYEEGGKEKRHGLWIERRRTRDRERFDQDFTEVRRMYYSGKLAEHRVESIYQRGVLRKRIYVLSNDLQIEVEYNERGEALRGKRASARGGRAKRERVMRVFDDVYDLNP